MVLGMTHFLFGPKGEFIWALYLMYTTICRYPKGHKMYLNDKIIQIGLVILVQFLLVGWSLTDWLTD